MRKPPSRRAERKLDETARAIARIREEARPEKTTGTAHLQSETLSKSGSLGPGATVKKAGQAKAPTVKRQKKG